MNRWLINLVIAFALRQIGQFGKDTDWELLWDETEDFVRSKVPGTWFDNEATTLARVAFRAVQIVLGNPASLQKILDLVAVKDWGQALHTLRMLIDDAWAPTNKNLSLAHSTLVSDVCDYTSASYPHPNACGSSHDPLVVAAS